MSIPDAGLLISGFAIGMLIGAPALAILTHGRSQRASLLGFLIVFALAHVGGAMAPNYLTLLLTRFGGAFAYAGFWAVASATAVGLVPAQARGRAMGVLVGGLTVATVIGLPAGTLIGQHLGWRGAFWTVAAVTVVVAIGVLAAIPRPAGPDRVPTAASEGSEPQAPLEVPGRLAVQLHALADRCLLSAYATTALASAALLVTFSYLAPLLIRTTGIEAGWVPGVFAVYGLGALGGIVLGSRTADHHPGGTLYLGLTGLIITSVALATTAQHLVAAIGLVITLGFTGFVTNPTLSSRPFGLVRAEPALVAAFNVSAFNVGITLGPWLGGVAIDRQLGYPSVGWIGAVLAAAAIASTAVTLRPALSVAAPPKARAFE